MNGTCYSSFDHGPVPETGGLRGRAFRQSVPTKNAEPFEPRFGRTSCAYRSIERES
jgi:hypothetical protein